MKPTLDDLAKLPMGSCVEIELQKERALMAYWIRWREIDGKALVSMRSRSKAVWIRGDRVTRIISRGHVEGAQ